MVVIPKRILAFDPGGTTGYAVLIDDKDDKIDTGILEGEHHHPLLNFLHDWAPETIVYERFDYRRNKKHAELDSVEYIGVIKMYGQMTNCPIIEQPQLKGQKGFWTDDKLKELELYTPNITHPNDAVRQLLYYITFTLKDLRWVEKLKA